MPGNQFERMILALLTAVVTVHGYVFCSLYVVNGSILMERNGAGGVLAATANRGGVYMLGRSCPIWAVVLVKFCLAYGPEVLMGSPCSQAGLPGVRSPDEPSHDAGDRCHLRNRGSECAPP